MSATIDLALVPSFVEVVRRGSFTAAATALGLPKSTVSRRVARLEAELGVPLLVRTTRKLRLTEAGHAFHARVAPAIEGVEEAARAIADQREEPRGVLRISVPPDYERMPAIVASFVARHPEVSVEIDVSGRHVDLVGEGFDLALRAGPLRDSSLVARKLTSVAFHVFGSEAYLARRSSPRRVRDLAAHDCVVFRSDRGVFGWRLTGPKGVEEVDVRGPITVGDLMFVRGAVLAGAGLALLPATTFGAGDPVRRVLPRHAMPGGAVHLVYPATRHVSAKVRAFRDHLLAQRWFG